MTSTLQVSYIDKELNALLGNLSDTQPSYSMHFNHNEEFFLKLSESFDVPHLPIHHDVRLRKPDSGYIDGLKYVISQLVELVPDLFRQATYFFDPKQIFKPRFFSLYRLEDRDYLYILDLDLMFRAQESGVIEKGSNDISPHFRSSHLYAEGIVIPLENVSVREGTIESFQIRQTLSDTWIGEKGRGYRLRGIWMDDELSKFFTKLFLPNGRRSYPYYPFICRYKSICSTVIPLSHEGGEHAMVCLDRALRFLLPSIPGIQRDLKGSSFSKDLPIFQRLKAEVPEIWNTFLKDLKIEVYLTEQGMKEYRIEL